MCPAETPPWPSWADYPQTEDGWNAFANAWLSRKRRAGSLGVVPIDAINDYRAAMAYGRAQGWQETE